ncbi:MAG: hypothetical protein H6618_06675 [Deltaproteobacteria bacterium]|nr:hypothetical protein [Deltaproteobacteria bacterium]
MGVREWDRKAKNLKTEIDVICERYGQSSGQNEKIIQNLHKQALKLQNDVETKLSWIQTLTKNRSFLSGTEKTLMHWARAWSEKAQEYYKSYGDSLQEIFWATMSWTRSGHMHESRSRHNAPIQTHYCQKETQKLNQKIKDLETRRQSLDQRYHQVAIARANQQATYILSPPDSDSSRLSGEPKQGSAYDLPSHEDHKQIISDNLNLHQQSEDRSEERDSYENNKNHDKILSQTRDMKDFIRSFDYLGLDDDHDVSLFS